MTANINTTTSAVTNEYYEFPNGVIVFIPDTVVGEEFQLLMSELYDKNGGYPIRRWPVNMDADSTVFNSISGKMEIGQVVWCDGDFISNDRTDSYKIGVRVLREVPGGEGFPYKRYECAYIDSDIESGFDSDAGWYSGLDDEGNRTYNHWTGAIEELRKKLKRGLSDEEICVVSISLAFGPTPGLRDDQIQSVMQEIWPDGNPLGLFVPPSRVRAALAKL